MYKYQHISHTLIDDSGDVFSRGGARTILLYEEVRGQNKA